MTQMEYYYLKKSLGLCVAYGCDKPAFNGKARCRYHLAEERKRYYKDKEAGARKAAPKKNPENSLKTLSEINSRARASGMSYGEYMAYIREGKTVV